VYKPCTGILVGATSQTISGSNPSRGNGGSKMLHCHRAATQLLGVAAGDQR
jgi:hypothetical protein